MAELPKAHPVDAFVRVHLPPPPYHGLSTSGTISAEIFAALEAYSEIEEAGTAFMKEKTGSTESECAELYFHFQAFVRQAKTFFTAAEHLHHRASPLFTYYAFMNLAKAYICRSNPGLILGQERLYHGLIAEQPRFPFKDESLQTAGGVFWQLYKGVTGIELPQAERHSRQPGLRLNVSEMFLYSSDMAFDYYTGKPEASRTTRGKSRFTSDLERSAGKWLLAIGNFDGAAAVPEAFKEFFDQFEEVELAKPVAERMFGIMGEALTAYRFFQSRAQIQLKSPESMAEFTSLLEPTRRRYLLVFPFVGEFEFQIGTPIGDRYQYPWNEMFASYALFYYLGSLVRYHPSYLESLLGSKEAWLITQFADTARLTLLRHFVILVLDKGYVFSNR